MAPPAVLMVGSGEYTTGFVGGSASTSDKKIGVVGLTLFDLRRRGKVGALSIVGTSGHKFPAIREHLHNNITKVYNNLDTSFNSYPANDKTDPEAYKAAIDALPAGSAITIFTPDSTHYPIAKYAIERKIHVMITKPATQLLSHHLELLTLSRQHGVFVYIEHHKRFDPAYLDAKHRAVNQLGDFNYWYSYMSQPKSQLATFKAWAGKDSDISYYLNSHHVDICAWIVGSLGWHPAVVRASASRGIAEAEGCVEGTEDTITLLVDWTHPDKAGKRATGIYTASWTAPQNAGVHSQQHFHYVASKGEVNVNQAKRGYEVVSDPPDATAAEAGTKWINHSTCGIRRTRRGISVGRPGMGVNEGKVTVEELDRRGLPTLGNTIVTTAILEAGRRSLDGGGKAIEILKRENDRWELR
ncbi:uncharacterized protein AB675_6263 [Cyphellophora attinorum]|uniref:Gfo/Idh/MocA-like oxidoreductase N-terminal domain-containing protein n=1 Tax=Cyphellophora attinorum TaxID=1664694 RepID=A0A0N1H9D3_9EURO|nr:uncharacterized protein AB675_6263 [Phialophora attinorum]KPI44042.1 hypothetical protein AB675_6263 [Phialophora attinorum]